MVGWRNKLSDIVTMFWTNVQYNVELIMTVGPRGSPIYNEFWRDVTMKHFLVYGAWSTFNWHVNRLNIKFARFIPALGADISHCIPVWKASFKFFRAWKYFFANRTWSCGYNKTLFTNIKFRYCWISGKTQIFAKLNSICH